MAKSINKNLNGVFAKSIYQYLRSTDNDDTFYAAVAYIDSDSYVARNGNNNPDNVLGTDSDLETGDEEFFAQNTISYHKLFPGGVARVIQRRDWMSGTTYQPWSAANRSYVLVKEFVTGALKLNVYQCLFSPRTPSTVPPSGDSVSPITTSDGYVWKYAYTISNSEAVRFLNDNWMPVPERVVSSEVSSLTSGTSRYSLYSVQENTVIGAIYDVLIDSEFDRQSLSDGSLTITAKDLSGTPSQSLSATLSLVDSEVVSSFTQEGVGYSNQVRVVNSTQDSENAPAIPGLTAIVAPGLGFGNDIPNELNADNIIGVIRNSPDGDVLQVMNDVQFNMVNMLKNPIENETLRVAEKDFYRDSDIRFRSGEYLFVDWQSVSLYRSTDQIESFSFVLNLK